MIFYEMTCPVCGGAGKLANNHGSAYFRDCGRCGCSGNILVSTENLKKYERNWEKQHSSSSPEKNLKGFSMTVAGAKDADRTIRLSAKESGLICRYLKRFSENYDRLPDGLHEHPVQYGPGGKQIRTFSVDLDQCEFDEKTKTVKLLF